MLSRWLLGTETEQPAFQSRSLEKGGHRCSDGTLRMLRAVERGRSGSATELAIPCFKVPLLTLWCHRGRYPYAACHGAYSGAGPALSFLLEK